MYQTKVLHLIALESMLSVLCMMSVCHAYFFYKISLIGTHVQKIYDKYMGCD